MISAGIQMPSRNTSKTLLSTSISFVFFFVFVCFVFFPTSFLFNTKDFQPTYSQSSLSLSHRGGFRAGQGYEMLIICSYLRETLDKFTYPVLLIHGTNDKVAAFQGSQLFFDTCGSKDKNLVSLHDFFHEPFEDPEKDKPISEIVNFFVRQSEVRE
jgi:hypothetical protein